MPISICAGQRGRLLTITMVYFWQLAGCRITQIPPLVVLYLGGPKSINEIAARLELDRTTLTRNLKPLEEAGLLEIAPGDDQRTRIAALTEHGREVLLGVLPVWEEAQTHIVQGLGGERFDNLLTQLEDIAALARDEQSQVS